MQAADVGLMQRLLPLLLWHRKTVLATGYHVWSRGDWPERCLRCYEKRGDAPVRCTGSPAPIVIDRGPACQPHR